MTNEKSCRTDQEAGEKGTLAPLVEEEGMTHFGFRRVPEKEKVSWVRNHFDTIAQRYDMMNTLLSFGIHYLWKRTAIRRLGLKEGDTVLDVCGGTGDLSLMALKNVGRPGKVVLCDINRAMMEAGRRKTTHAEARKEIRFVQGNAEQISFRSDSFDAVMVGFGVRNLTHVEEGLREMYRVLKPGGRFICLEFSRPTAAWFRRLYDFYSFRVMPLLGCLIVGSRQAYTYLPESIRLFPSAPEFSRLLEDIGFRRVSYHLLTNGIAAVHLGSKEADSPVNRN